MSLTTLAAQTSPNLPGRVLNGTTNQPVPNVAVEFILLQQGMASAGTATTDSQGKFRFNGPAFAARPALLRVDYQGATYSHVLQPLPDPQPEVEIPVYEADRQPGLVTATEHLIFLQPSGDILWVVEEVLLENRSSPPKTYVNTEGTFRFLVPEQLREGVKVYVEGPGGMPLNQPPIPKDKPGSFAISYPLRPGQTQVHLEYALNYQSPFAFSKSLEEAAERTHVLTPGEGVQVQGETLVSEGTEPTSGFIAYRITPVNNQVRLQISGQAVMPESASGAAAAPGSLVPILDPVSQRRTWILGLLGMVLLGGLVYHYTR
ncbi:MAG: carboxypeptidase regulatory-like domain-containing protein [Acidobacteria bacterium]|nr:carboxypeptidase regulatory-like domain-containing protein [Acidobacteriota bacterium]